ncbi:LysR family transcriptional regulator [Gilvimarinus sp. 1_MG-2023]|uniref:LysR family transcriptional regulator n=1 Tax=Gilvimarinus sp. 1_MG-2023 TaxID=3062638 RepID=UPI0026E2F271|nr:LysR family transcriptional regulator [Gilvimarinus sp. 1_MG-2023]MDO6746385.1 LysR substrate-binding domain-containing protein [Gilvimarinus sp. 1_MG-2023]
MELKTLRTFVAVAELRNFSAAARKLHTVQPAVSRQIADLEAELGTSLLWRSTREVRMTAAGEVLLEDARRLLALEVEARERVLRAGSGQIGQLRIGYMSSATARFLPALLQRFGRAHPDVHLELFEMTAQQQLEAFAREEIDLGFSRPLPERVELASLPLYSDPLVAVVPLSHSLANRRRLSLEVLAQENFVLFERAQASDLFDRIIGACGAAGFSPRVVRQAAHMQTLLSQVASGIGVAIAPACIRFLQSEGCVFIALQPALPAIELELHYAHYPVRPTVESFVAQACQMREHIKTQMEYRELGGRK